MKELVKRPVSGQRTAVRQPPPVTYSGGVSNSAMAALLGVSEPAQGCINPDLEARFRNFQLPSAEREADRLSAGITVGTPEAVKEAMGEKLGADFSAVRFHTDSGAAAQADAIGARAYASGGDVYFGGGGFDPAVAAHELVHTVQQGVVASAAPTLSAPVGAVQMKPVIGQHRQRYYDKKDAQTLGQLNAPGGNLGLEAMPDKWDFMREKIMIGQNRKKKGELPLPPIMELNPMYAQLVSVLEDIDRISGGDLPEHIKNRMLGGAYAKAQQITGLLEMGGIRGQNAVQAARVHEISEKVNRNAQAIQAANAPVQINRHQHKAQTSGGLNSVGIYNVPGAKDRRGEENERKFFKKEVLSDKAYRDDAEEGGTANTELTLLMPHLGLNAGEGDQVVDRHLRDREIGYSLLNDFLGAGVAVGAREAVDENGNVGALLDEAKGMTANEYGWDYLAPDVAGNADTLSRAQQEQMINLADTAGETPTHPRRYGERLNAANVGLTTRSFDVTRKDKQGKDILGDDGNPVYAPRLNIKNSKFHRDVNRMQILDALTGHVDRHGGNFKIETDEQGNYKGLKAIDNDLSFGRKQHLNGTIIGGEDTSKTKTDGTTANGPKVTGFNRFHNSPGMYAGSLIDKEMADRIKGTRRQDLDYLFHGMFSDDEQESQEVIDNLWQNFQAFNTFAEENQAYQVDNWTEEHAEQELRTATGMLQKCGIDTKSQNTLFQRLAMSRLGFDPAMTTTYYLKNLMKDSKNY